MDHPAELLTDTLESYLIDPHGSGRSTSPRDASAYSPEGHAVLYDEVRHALDLGEVLLFGESFGATTALTYAALFPEHVSGCIAVSAFGVGPAARTGAASSAEAEAERGLVRRAGAAWYPEARPVMDEWTERVLAADDAHEVERMLRLVLPMYTAHPDRPDVAAGLEALRRRVTFDLAAVKAWEAGPYQTIDLRRLLLAKITCPTLVVAGELDFMCRRAQARPTCEAIPSAQLEIIPDCGHFPVEASRAYNEAVRLFLAASRKSAGGHLAPSRPPPPG
jgi:pimeloyl-ACP methyl ester carboxylesterase